MLQWYYFAIASAVLMMAATIIEKYALRREHAASFSTSTNLIVTILSLAFIPLITLNIGTYQWFLLIVGGVMAAASYLLTARLFRHGSMVTTTTAFSSLPILFVVVLAYVFLGEQLTLIQYVSIAVLIIATYLLIDLKRDVPNKNYRHKFEIFLLINSFFMAAGAVILKFQLGYINYFTYLVFNQIFMMLFFFFFMEDKYGGVKETVRDIKKYTYIVIPMGLLTLGYRLLGYVAVSLAPVSLASPLRNVVFVMLIALSGGFLFKEKQIKRKVLLSIVIVIFSYFLLV